MKSDEEIIDETHKYVLDIVEQDKIYNSEKIKTLSVLGSTAIASALAIVKALDKEDKHFEEYKSYIFEDIDRKLAAYSAYSASITVGEITNGYF
jgi:hypothetical protein